MIPAVKVRSFESEAIQVCEDHYNSNENNIVGYSDDDSDIEVIPKESVLYSDALQKSKMAAAASTSSIVDEINDAVGTYGDEMMINQADYDPDEIEDAEDVLAMELDMLTPLSQENNKNSNINNVNENNNNSYDTKSNNREENKQLEEGHYEDDYGIEVVDEGSAINLEILLMEKSSIFKGILFFLNIVFYITPLLSFLGELRHRIFFAWLV